MGRSLRAAAQAARARPVPFSAGQSEPYVVGARRKGFQGTPFGGNVVHPVGESVELGEKFLEKKVIVKVGGCEKDTDGLLLHRLDPRMMKARTGNLGHIR
jgi:hypothetical protein